MSILRSCLAMTAIIGTLILTGCYNLPRETGPTPFEFQRPSPSEQILGDLRWGLAISGGGTRSATFSMGVLKALYDRHVLDSVQIISSVSGGGYAGYWLYTQELSGPAGKRFGERALSSERFPTAMCEVIAHNNFYSNWEIAKTALNPRETLVEGYDFAIRRTFGRAVLDSLKVRENPREYVEPNVIAIHHLADHVRSGRVPYWVTNTTLVKPRSDSGWASGLYEITPFFRGNERFGYEPWSGQSVPLRKAVAMSGAATRSLLHQRIPNVHPGVPGTEISLADGGDSENLGAVALIRRRVKNIIVIDAEQDHGYGFNAYRNLKTRLESWGYALSVPGIDRVGGGGRDSATYRGLVKSLKPGDSYTADVYYVKMSRPRSIDPVLANVARADSGENTYTAVRDSLDAHRLENGDWNCGVLRRQNIPLAPWFTYAVREYSGFRPETRRPVLFPELGTEFPQHTTFDQSFYYDQSLAYIGLGYFEGLEAADRIAHATGNVVAPK